MALERTVRNCSGLHGIGEDCKELDRTARNWTGLQGTGQDCKELASCYVVSCYELRYGTKLNTGETTGIIRIWTVINNLERK
jgi:hypothetical protein